MRNRFIYAFLPLVFIFFSSFASAETTEFDGLRIIVSYSQADSNAVEKMALDIPVIPASAFHFWTDNLKTEVIYNRLDDDTSASKQAELAFIIFRGSELLASPKMRVLSNKEAVLELDDDRFKLKISVLFRAG